jgi:hypothetical protein
VGCTPKSARRAANEWRSRPDIARAVNLWIKEKLAKAMPESAGPIAQQAETLVRTAWLTATANIQWFTKISADGTCLVPDFTHCTEEMMQAIESIDVEERESPDGDNVTRRIRLRLKNSVRAMELLARAMGMDRREVKVGLSEQVSIGVQMVEALRRKLLGGTCSDNSSPLTDR